MQKLKLSPKQIRELQKKHGIENLLQPSPEEAKKVASLDFLCDFLFEGSRKWEKPPERDEVEDMDFREILDAWQNFMKVDAGGNG